MFGQDAVVKFARMQIQPAADAYWPEYMYQSGMEQEWKRTVTGKCVCKSGRNESIWRSSN